MRDEIVPNRVYNYQETQKVLGLGDWSLFRAIKTGKLKASKPNRKYLILGSDILEFLKRTQVKVSAYSEK